MFLSSFFLFLFCNVFRWASPAAFCVSCFLVQHVWLDDAQCVGERDTYLLSLPLSLFPYLPSLRRRVYALIHPTGPRTKNAQALLGTSRGKDLTGYKSALIYLFLLSFSPLFFFLPFAFHLALTLFFLYLTRALITSFSPFYPGPPRLLLFAAELG